MHGDSIMVIPLSSEAGKAISRIVENPDTHTLRLWPAGQGLVKVKMNGGEWSPALETYPHHSPHDDD